MDERTERMEEALQEILRWGDAYPTSIFPEPSREYLHRAAVVLQQNGMTLDRISAACMRHVVTGLAKIAREALE